VSIRDAVAAQKLFAIAEREAMHCEAADAVSSMNSLIAQATSGSDVAPPSNPLTPCIRKVSVIHDGRQRYPCPPTSSENVLLAIANSVARHFRGVGVPRPTATAP
jgi:hypothetical protein